FSIFDDIGDYIPPATSKPKDKERHRVRDEDSKSRRHAYFEKPRVDEHPLMDVDTGPGSIKDQIKMINEKFGTARRDSSKEQLGDFFGGSNSYAECYPATMDDLAVDSDEEVDYSKMDQVGGSPSMPCCWRHGVRGECLWFCSRGTRRVRWAAGTSTPRRSTLIT
uniref:Protein RED C-terminal domain-containing protein n=1 Tax=Poecilia latipinna TaxID=48699 RepID=A0A3B3TME8_9TELE